MISVSAFLTAELVAAALLALWVVVRFPKLGPKSLRSALGGLVACMAVLKIVPFGVNLMVRLPHGTYAALFGCALPCFFAAFLVGGWTMRLLVGRFGGSGGGGGHRVPARARG
jgi:energy-coupling factor transporter transmembrane protein EcfT